MFKQPGKKARLQAAQKFKRELDPEELRLFEESYEKDTNKWHQEFKDEWKEIMSIYKFITKENEDD